MATIAAGETAGRNTTGTRIDLPVRLGRGAVVMAADCYAIAWHPVGSTWLALPLALQHGPLHRSDVILAATDVALFAVPRGRLLVQTAQPILVAEDAPVIGRADHALLDRIAITLRRAAVAYAIEAGFARP